MRNMVSIVFSIVLLLIIQIIINSATIFYVDILGIVLIVFLMSSEIRWPNIIWTSILADLFGYWFLGTHLIAIVVLSIVIQKLINFYRMVNWLARYIFTSIAYLCMSLVIYIVDELVGKTHLQMINILFTLLFIIPLVLFVTRNFFVKDTSGIIWYD